MVRVGEDEDLLVGPVKSRTCRTTNGNLSRGRSFEENRVFLGVHNVTVSSSVYQSLFLGSCVVPPVCKSCDSSAMPF